MMGEGATPLMYACQQAREKDCLELLAKKPAAAREKDRTHKTPLHYCAESINTSCAEALLRVAPDMVNARDEDGYSPLHLAVIAGNKPLIQLLLTRGADVNALDHEKHSVVHWATVCGEHEALEMVLRAGANISSPDMHGGFPLHYAAQMCGPGADLRGDSRAGLAVLRTLLAFGADVDESDKDGRQPILWAASAGSAEAILSLVKAGAKVEAADKDGLTALHCAASRGHTDCLETLVALCGGHVDTIDVNGCTALFYAATLGHADSTQLLLSLGAEPNRQDRKGRTPAHCGAAKGQLETLRLLLAGGANLWLRNVKGDLPLHEAVASGRRELVRWLLNQRPEAVNVANNDGKCPIHVAAINNNVEMVKILLDAGSLVNPVLRSNKGGMLTPLDAALLRGHRSCAKFLQLHGGVPRTKLTDTSAALRGTMPREMLSTDRSRDGDGFMRLPPPSVSALSTSPRFLNETPMRLNTDDVAIRHVERIEVPVCQHQEQRFDGESSEEERRYRRRRRRRRSERRRRESLPDEDSNEDVSQDSSSRPLRKSGKGRSASDGVRRSKKNTEKEERQGHKSKESDYSSEEESESSLQGKGKMTEEDSPPSPPKKSNKKTVTQPKSNLGKRDTKKAKNDAKTSIENTNKKNGTVVGKNNVKKGNGRESVSKKIANGKVDVEEVDKAIDDAAEFSNLSKVVSTKSNDTPEVTTSVVEIALTEHMEVPEVDSARSVVEPEAIRAPSLVEPEAVPATSLEVTEAVPSPVLVPDVTSADVPEPDVVENCFDRKQSLPQPDSSLDDNESSLPITVEVEAEVHQPAIPDQVEERISMPAAEELLSGATKQEQPRETPLESPKIDSAPMASHQIPPPLNEPVIYVKQEISVLDGGGPKVDEELYLKEDSFVSHIDNNSPTRAVAARRRSVVQEIIRDTEDPIRGEDTSPGSSERRDVAFFKMDESRVPGRRRSLTQADGSEVPDGEEESGKANRARRKSFVFGESVKDEEDISAKGSRRRSDVGAAKSAHRGRRGSTESEEREELALRERVADIDTVIRDVLLGEPEPRSGSVGDDSGGSMRYEDSSALPDSGIEPSPRRERRERPSVSPSLSAGRRIPRLCRKGRGEQPVAPVSVTRAVQNTIRKYHLERKIFYQLLELKRLQIRAGRANEQVLVKRLVDEYQRAGHVAGLSQYTGVYSFRQFETFLYEQLQTLQAGTQLVIPQLKPTDDIETLSAILKRTRVELQEGTPDNPMLCTHSTHRCSHATHAYTGIPCAAYIAKLNHHTMPKDAKASFLPRIDPALTVGRAGSQRAAARPSHADRPVTLELIHGRDKQIISLPTDRLDRSKRYYVTFTIKGGGATTPTHTSSPAAEGVVSHHHGKTV